MKTPFESALAITTTRPGQLASSGEDSLAALQAAADFGGVIRWTD
jgi:hypothetical protein